jgi:hypothetical protein
VALHASDVDPGAHGIMMMPSAGLFLESTNEVTISYTTPKRYLARDTKSAGRVLPVCLALRLCQDATSQSWRHHGDITGKGSHCSNSIYHIITRNDINE